MFQWKLVFAFIFVLVCKIPVMAGGFRVGTGGDIVFCAPFEETSFKGYYLLDYLLTYNHTTANADVIGGDQTLEVITKALENKIPELGRSLRKFVTAMQGQIFIAPDYTKNYIWIPQRMGLNDLTDEFLFEKLPKNCYKPGHPDQVQIIQAVIREERPHSVILRYDELQLKELRRQSELQFSFMMVHEWLWHYSANAGIVRDANRYLHSNIFFEQTSGAAELSLRNIGVDIDRPPIKPALETVEYVIRDCDNLPEIEVKLSREVGVQIKFVNYGECAFYFSDFIGIERDIPAFSERMIINNVPVEAVVRNYMFYTSGWVELIRSTRRGPGIRVPFKKKAIHIVMD
ncbi:MAG: hypothetical protein AB7O96_09705 [Pseudobdellovibrionaceae bacterium]